MHIGPCSEYLNSNVIFPPEYTAFLFNKASQEGSGVGRVNENRKWSCVVGIHDTCCINKDPSSAAITTEVLQAYMYKCMKVSIFLPLFYS